MIGLNKAAEQIIKARGQFFFALFNTASIIPTRHKRYGEYGQEESTDHRQRDEKRRRRQVINEGRGKPQIARRRSWTLGARAFPYP